MQKKYVDKAVEYLLSYVDDEESCKVLEEDFALPITGYNTMIVARDGRVALRRDGEESIKIDPFQPDKFDILLSTTSQERKTMRIIYEEFYKRLKERKANE